jgi:hypothetical protein
VQATQALQQLLLCLEQLALTHNSVLSLLSKVAVQVAVVQPHNLVVLVVLAVAQAVLQLPMVVHQHQVKETVVEMLQQVVVVVVALVVLALMQMALALVVLAVLVFQHTHLGVLQHQQAKTYQAPCFTQVVVVVQLRVLVEMVVVV